MEKPSYGVPPSAGVKNSVLAGDMGDMGATTAATPAAPRLELPAAPAATCATATAAGVRRSGEESVTAAARMCMHAAGL